MVAARTVIRLMSVFATFIAVVAGPAHAGKEDRALRLVDSAAGTLNYFASDNAFEAMWGLAADAKAIVVIPNNVRAGFIIAGSSGNAAMIAREEDGDWSEPVFMLISSGSIGFQIGGEASEIVLLVMTNRGKEQLLSTSAKLGADLTLAAGPVGAGGKAQTTDILAFSRSRGLYGGVSVEGAVLKIREKYNQAYYGRDVTPIDIIYRGIVANPASAKLQRAASRLADRQATRQVPVLAPAIQATPLGAAPDAGSSTDSGAASSNAGAPAYEDDEAWGAPIKQR
ncbi:MAG: lipid-binding SYLF domain-containing protein [Pseudomonadota bacterium]